MRKQSAAMAVFLLLFFLAMLFPLWGQIFPQPHEESLNENRAMTELDQTGSLKDRIANAEAFLNDHLAFREPIISAVLRTDLCLGESPHSQVLAGQDGWLFYREGGEDFRTDSGLDDESLESLYYIQQTAADAFAAAGADYRILIAPDKHSVYPEYLPMTNRLGNEVWELDQIMTSPGPEYTVRFLDVRQALLDAAESGTQQYYKTDTHWSSAGAWTAYQAIMDQLEEKHPNLRRLTEADVIHTTVTDSGDLASMIGQKGLLKYDCEAVAVSAPAAQDASAGDGETLSLRVNSSVPDGPVMLFIHDSFGPALIPFLEESVSELYLLSNESPSLAEMGDLSRFDIVIFEVVERNRSWLWDGIGGTFGGTDGDEE